MAARKTLHSEPNSRTLRMDLMSHAFVINDLCIKDMRCVAACMRKAIHPTLNDLEYAESEQLHINPLRCIGCGSCANVCPTGAILAPGDSPSQFPHFAELNAAWYRG
jgi:ferredoxin--NADP+ reductase